MSLTVYIPSTTRLVGFCAHAAPSFFFGAPINDKYTRIVIMEMKPLQHVVYNAVIHVKIGQSFQSPPLLSK